MRKLNMQDSSEYNNDMISTEIMEYMVWIIEIAAHEFFNDNKTKTYKVLRDTNIWNLYIENYDVTHTLGAEYLKNEMREVLKMKGFL